jgi:hypothetical protein
LIIDNKLLSLGDLAICYNDGFLIYILGFDVILDNPWFIPPNDNVLCRIFPYTIALDDLGVLIIVVLLVVFIKLFYMKEVIL